MTLSDQQYLFAKDFIYLGIYIRDDEEIDKFSIGEVWRPLGWQKILYEQGKSQVLKGDHQDKMACDIYFWINGKFVKNEWENKPLLLEIGEYWEGLSQYNYWGGNFESFCDLNHFGRRKIINYLNNSD